MNKVIKSTVHLMLVLAAFIAFAVTGCSTVEIDKDAAKKQIAYVLKTAYAYGGAEAVSNKIETLVTDGKLDAKQAAQLHALAEKVYEDAIAHLEKEGEDADLTPEGE